MSLATSVVICAYTEDRWDQLRAAVASVESQWPAVDEIVVVIDHHEGLLARATTAWPTHRVVANGDAPGLSGARNTGVEVSAGDVVVFLDDDAVAEQGWLQHLLEPYRDPRVLGVGGAAQPVWETRRPTWWPEEFDWVVGCSYRGQPTSTGRVRNLMGCSMSLRRSVLLGLGGFDHRLGRTATDVLGCEETELCIRASRAWPDGMFLHEPRAVVHHWVPAARASWSYFRARCWAEGVSKARMARALGPTTALSTERDYVRHILLAAVGRDLREAVRTRGASLERAGAVVGGLACTATGYLATRASTAASRSERLRSRSEAEPVLPLIVDLGDDQPGPSVPDTAGPDFTRALCLVTCHGAPLAKVPLDLADGSLHGADLTARLREALPAEARASLESCPDRHGQQAQLAPSDVTVVVATHDRPAQLGECLRSILDGFTVPTAVVVVDNAPSTEETAALVALLAAEEPRLQYVREDRPGLARAHNAALPWVRSPVVAFTDDDVLVDRRWLAQLTAPFAEDPGVACVTGLIAPRELDTLAQQWVEGNVTYDKGLVRRVFDTKAYQPADPLFPLTAGVFGSGANMAFRTTDLLRRGGFDESLGTGTAAMGGDDLAAFYDVVTAGSRLVYEPSAIVLHQHHRTYAGLRRQVYGYGAGLGAHLTRCLVRDPKMALRLVRHAAVAGRRAARILAPPTVTGLPAFPADLRRQQMLGLASGPWRYALSRQRLRGSAAA